jgi:hypothetical protein
MDSLGPVTARPRRDASSAARVRFELIKAPNSTASWTPNEVTDLVPSVANLLTAIASRKPWRVAIAAKDR